MSCEKQEEYRCTDCPGEDRCLLLQPTTFYIDPANPNIETPKQESALGAASSMIAAYHPTRRPPTSYSPVPFTPYRETFTRRVIASARLAIELGPTIACCLAFKIFPNLVRMAFGRPVKLD